MLGLRVVLVVLGFALGIVLLANGHVLIGGLIATMAVVRAVLVHRWHSMSADRRARRQAIRARIQERRTAAGR